MTTARSTSQHGAQLHLFSSPRLELNGSPVAIDTRKAIALLAYLAVTNKRHSREHLANLLWPEADQVHASGALRRTLSAINSALGSHGVVTQRDSVTIAPEVWCDVSEFRRLVKGGDLTSAIGLHTGDFMAGFALRDSAPFEDWQLAEAEALQRELAEVLRDIAVREVDAGRLYDALVHARRWLALDPLHEAAHRLLMQFYSRAGDRPAALRQYRDCVRVLDEELGVPPLEETTALYEAIKAGELPAPAPPQSAHKAATSVGALDGALVGREEQWAALERAYQAAAQGGHMAVLEGEAGIGKTRLALDFLERMRGRGALVLATTCYEGEAGLAYAPILSIARTIAADPALTARLAGLPDHVLAEGARLLPELGTGRAELPPVQALNSPAAQLRFFDCIAQILTAVLAPPLTAGQPSILFIDDAQWADEATLDLLAYVARRLSGSGQPVLLLFAWRGEHAPPQHRLRQIFGLAAREHRATLISLSRLSLHSTHALLRDALAHAGSGLDEVSIQALAARLQAESEGLPLFVTEYIAMMRNDPNAAPDAAQGAWPMPQSVRDILRTRLTSLDDASLQLLGAAAVIGRAFDGDLLQQVSGRSDDETADSLEHLTRAGLTREAAANAGYDFIHDKLREVVYADLSLGRRRLLHRRAAESLLARARGRGQRRANPLASQIAQHYRLAGKDAEAAEQFKLAGDHARSIFANAEALAHYRDALALGYPDSAALHVAIADLHVLAGDYASAVTRYEMAAAQAQSSGAALAAIEHKLGNVHHRRGEWALADDHYQAALDLFGACDKPEPCARLLADQSLNAHRNGETQRAQVLAERALTLAERGGDPRALAQTHNILGVLARNGGDLPKAITAFEQSLAFAQKLDEPTARVAALNNLGLALADHGEQPRALAALQEALALCAAQGDRHRQAALHNNIADVRHAMGDQAGAMADLTQAVKLFAEIGLDADAGALQPEIWKLAEW